MNQPKPTSTLAGQLCPCCSKGHFALVQINHTEAVAEDNPIVIKNVWAEQCDTCGEVVFPGETSRFIEAAVADETEQLTAKELERIREDLGVATQDEMSEILGLGSKTFHKWESGKQFPTRSMSYYIRVLAEFPQGFDWLSRRAWRSSNRLSKPVHIADFESMFPHLAHSGRATTATLHTNDLPPRNLPPTLNPARGLFCAVFHAK
jgi:putative zinc finger/helix-turn-helix YgiT family protein